MYTVRALSVSLFLSSVTHPLHWRSYQVEKLSVGSQSIEVIFGGTKFMIFYKFMQANVWNRIHRFL